MTNSAVDVQGLGVVRSGVTVLRDLSFEIPPGCITGLLGPSGCGKTTLIRTIAGTQRITSGTVDVLGRPAGTPSLRPLVAYAAQTAAVYGDLSMAENVQYFAAVLGAPAGDVERVIDAVDLGGYRRAPVARLSGGERSRVSLAVALLGKPQLLLLDEPTVGLDPVLREELWNVFRSLADDGLTLLVSSHVMDEAARCDNLLLMRGGELLTSITPAALRDETGSDDLERAFLTLIRESERSAA
jgi:ABC-2 type transport system ATP-binding protein